ncbi:MAG: serine hydrolase [Gemmatimonadales bacterium]
MPAPKRYPGSGRSSSSSRPRQLVEAGKIGLDDEIIRYLLDYPTQGNRITIRHLLSHTSGIKSYPGIRPKFWNEASHLDLTDDQMLALFKPGRSARTYSTSSPDNTRSAAPVPGPRRPGGRRPSCCRGTARLV